MIPLRFELPDALLRKLTDLAAQHGQPLEQFAIAALQDYVRTATEFGGLERRARRGDREKFRAAMAKVPNVPPMPGDELPKG